MDEWKQKAYLDGCFSEYDSVRADIRDHFTRFYTILQFGSTAILGFAGVALNFWGKSNALVVMTFAFLIPTMGFVFIELLMGQIACIRRAATFMRILESKMHSILGDPFSLEDRIESPQALGWETWIAGRSSSDDRHYMWIYTFGISLFFVISVLSIGVSVFYLLRGSLLSHLLIPIQTHRLGMAITLGAILFFFEAFKTSIWLAQARDIAHPLKVPLFVEVKNIWIKRVRAALEEMGFVKSTTSVSGVLLASLQAIIIYRALGIGGFGLFSFVVIFGTISTSFRSEEKQKREKGSRRPRTWKNALANAGVPTVFAIASQYAVLDSWRHIFVGAFVGSLAAAFSDTLSHELGVVLGGSPRLITSFRKVQPGENGAVSIVGSMVGVSAAAIVAALGHVLGLTTWRMAIVASMAAIGGNLVDSLLGATLEQKRWVDNNVVNFCCTLAAAGIVVAASHYLH